MASNSGKNIELALRIRADLKQAQDALRRLHGDLLDTGDAGKKAGYGLKETGDAAARARNEIGQMPPMLRNLAAAMVTAFSAREIAQAAEAYTTIRNRLALVTESSEDLANAQDAVFQIAQSGRQPLDATAELYQRIATNAEALNLSGAGVAGVVDTINKTLAISGTSGQAASAALTQLGQAFASGTLRGEELNSVLEQAPALAKSLADGLGVTTGELRQLGQDGKLSAQNLIQALQSQAGAVDAQFSKIQTTGAQAMTVLGNSLTRIIGDLNDATGAGSAFGDTVIALSRWLDSGVLTEGLVDSLSIWSGTFEAIGNDISSLNIDLEGVAASGDETIRFLARAFKEMPANLRSAIQIATTEILALLDKTVAYARFAKDSIDAVFSDNTQENVAQELERRLAQINSVREQSIVSIIEERDAILAGAAAERERRDAERKAREEARLQRAKDIELLRKQATSQPAILGVGNTGQNSEQAEAAEKYVKQLEQQAATIGKTAAEVRQYELAEKNLTGTLHTRAAAALVLIEADEKKRHSDKQQAQAIEQASRAYESLRDTLRKPAEIAIETAIDRVGVLNDALDKGIVKGAQYEDGLGRIVGAGFTNPPDFSGLSPEFGGVDSEQFRLDEKKAELESWYSEQQALLDQFRSKKIGTEDQWNAQELEIERRHQDALSGLQRAQAELTLINAQNSFDSLASIAASAAGKQSTAYKALFAISKGFATAQAAASLAINLAKATELGFPQNLPFIAGALGQGAQIAGILASAQYADGGYVRGPGTGTSDSIPARLSNGEYVLRAAVVGQEGMRPLLDDLNARGQVALKDWSFVARHATGGLAGVPAPAMPRPIGGGVSLAEPAKNLSTTVQNKLRVVNLLDTDKLAGEIFNNRLAEKTILNVIAMNPQTVRQHIS